MRNKRDTLPQGTVPEPLESAERVTVSTPPRSEAATGSRRSHTEVMEIPSRWMERLLLLWSELPVAAGDRAVTQAVVDAVASLTPDYAVAACLVPLGDGVQQVVRASSSAGAPHATGSDPARIFPGYTYERVVEIEPGGSTLHIAGDDAGCEDASSLTSALAARAAVVARRGLELARMQARAGGAIEELRSLNAHMVQAEKLASLGQIAAGVVHELNNPLTSIVAYTDYLIRKASLRKESPETDEVDRLRRIAESAGRMLRFTRDLVSYARPSSEIPVQVKVHLVIDQAIAFCEHVIADAGVTVERRFAQGAPLPVVCGKPEQLAQIFVNLVTNACHAMSPGGGTLTVTTRVDGGEVRIELADTGHGILPEHLPHVFTPFFTTKTSGAGTGLGLAIVRSIVDGHDGAIRVTSAPGEGAVFVLTLPAATG